MKLRVLNAAFSGGRFLAGNCLSRVLVARTLMLLVVEGDGEEESDKEKERDKREGKGWKREGFLEFKEKTRRLFL